MLALAEIDEKGDKFGLAFADGWKTFDHLWVDIFFCARVLSTGGFLVLDDGRMKSVRKAVKLLVRYYDFELISTFDIVGGTRLRLWYWITSRKSGKPYVALRKRSELSKTAAGTRYDFWERF